MDHLLRVVLDKHVVVDVAPQCGLTGRLQRSATRRSAPTHSRKVLATRVFTFVFRDQTLS